MFFILNQFSEQKRSSNLKLDNSQTKRTEIHSMDAIVWLVSPVRNVYTYCFPNHPVESFSPSMSKIVSVDVDVVMDELYQKQCVLLCANETICWTMFSYYLICLFVCVEMCLLSFSKFLLSFAPASVMGVCARKLHYRCSIRYAPTSTLNINILCKFVIGRLNHTHTHTHFSAFLIAYTLENGKITWKL